MNPAFARDACTEVGPGGQFLGCAHTMRNYQTAFYKPALSNSDNVESWEQTGALDMRQRANNALEADAGRLPATTNGRSGS